MAILTTDGLTKHYGRITAVNKLSLTVEKGNIYGILGPNGSGKTTTLGIILGIIHQSAGNYAWFDGQYTKNPRLRVGALLETPNFYPYMNAVDNLDIIAHIKGVKNTDYDHLLDLVNLRKRKLSKFKTYSLGMKQRLAIAAAMIGDPEVLIFDEPTNGLDPQGIAEVRETIREIGRSEKTILMASHILDEVEKVCSHVAIIKEGSLLATGSVGAIINSELEVQIASEDHEQLKTALSELDFVKGLKEKENRLLFNMDGEVSTTELNKLLYEKGIILSHLVAKKRSLEEEFLEITK